MKRNVLKLVSFIVLANVLCMFLVRVGAAWDGERQGFLLGVGFGHGSAKESYPVLSGNVTGLAMDFKIGYALTNFEALIISIKNIRGKFEFGDFRTSETYNDQLRSLSFISWFSERTPSVYLTGGIGSIFSRNFREPKKSFRNRIGLHFGIGIEFARHGSIEFNVMPPAAVDFDGTIKMYLLTVNVLGY